MAKLINCWRENCWSVFTEWRRQHGDASAFKFARRQPARCLAGRWGSTFATENLLVQIAEALPPVLKEVLEKRANDRDLDNRDIEEADDLRIEAQAEYRRRIGRWSRDTIQVSADSAFWFVVAILHRLHTVLDSIMALCNKFNFMRLGTNKHVMELRGGLVFQLATGTAVQLATAIDDMLKDRVAWRAIFDRAPLCAAGAPSAELVNLLALNQSASFHRRLLLAATTSWAQVCVWRSFHKQFVRCDL